MINASKDGVKRELELLQEKWKVLERKYEAKVAECEEIAVVQGQKLAFDNVKISKDSVISKPQENKCEFGMQIGLLTIEGLQKQPVTKDIESSKAKSEVSIDYGEEMAGTGESGSDHEQ